MGCTSKSTGCQFSSAAAPGRPEVLASEFQRGVSGASRAQGVSQAPPGYSGGP